MRLGPMRVAIGVDWAGDAVDLVALGVRFGRFALIDALRLIKPESDGAAGQVREFLSRNRLQENRVVACLPRSAVLVRFLDLPAEAEPKLAQIVGYQVSALHPFGDGAVDWDCAVLGHEPARKQISVMVVLAERSRLQEYKQKLQGLGLHLSGLTTLAAACGPLLKSALPEAAVVVVGRSSAVELMSFQQGHLCATQEVPAEPETSAGERLEREVHRALAALPASASATVPWFVVGPVPQPLAAAVEGAVVLPSLSLKLKPGPGSFEPAVQFGALAAAHAGLTRKASTSINLLPQEERWRPHRTARVPAYVLGGLAASLVLVTALHSGIENVLYSRALDGEIQHLAGPASRVRAQVQESGILAGRIAVLEGVRAGDWQKLRLLQELTRLLPDGTWLQQVQIDEDSVEIYGYSSRAADLVPPLENSRYFRQVEFTMPITRDNQNREIFRIRMQLKQPKP